MNFIVLLLSVFTARIFLVQSPNPCFQSKLISQNVSQQENTQTFYSCGWWGWKRCTRTRSYTVYKTNYKQVSSCCSGHDGSECLPQCEPSCGTNQVCSSPNTCTCLSGWKGENCSTEITKCTNGDHKCDQGCSSEYNNSYSCYCFGSNILADNNQTCLGEVSDFKGIPGKDSLYLSWSPPVNHSSTLTEYNITCYGGSLDKKVYSINASMSYNVSSLSPFTVYTCCIEPHWENIGKGPVVCSENTTLEDAPSDSPHNVTIIAVDPNSVQVEWSPPLIPNGILTHYNIYINYTNGTDIDSAMVDSSSTLYLLEQLKVYQLVGVSVSATTGGGEGPQSLYTFGRSGEAEAPLSSFLSVDVISNHTANISWHPPATLLDDNTTYSLIIRNLTKSYSGTAINEWALHLSEVFNVTEAALEPYIPYEVSVVVTANNISEGHIISVVFFTIESVPSVPPLWVETERVSVTTITLKWSALTLEESRGFVTKYTIKYRKMDNVSTCSVSIAIEAIETNGTQLVLNQLNSSQSYCVAIAAATEVGTGIFSEWLAVEVYNSQTVYFLLDRINECEQWVQQNSQIILNDFTIQLITWINNLCNCSITLDYIYKISILQCVGELAIVETSIFFHDNESLVQYIEEWIELAPNNTIAGAEVIIELCTCTSSNNCSYLIFISDGYFPTGTTSTTGTTGSSYKSSYSFSPTRATANTSSSYLFPLITSVLVLAAIIAIGLCTFVTIVVVIFKRKRSRSRYIIKDDGSANMRQEFNLNNPFYTGVVHVLASTPTNKDDQQNDYEKIDYSCSNQNDKNDTSNYSLAMKDKSQVKEGETIYSECGESGSVQSDNYLDSATIKEAGTSYDRLRYDGFNQKSDNDAAGDVGCYSTLEKVYEHVDSNL